jgi:hypothetical protein
VDPHEEEEVEDPTPDSRAKEEVLRGSEDAVEGSHMELTDLHHSVKMMGLLRLKNSRRSEYGMRSIRSLDSSASKAIEHLGKRRLGGWSICTR